jgi:hypothetical protein
MGSTRAICGISCRSEPPELADRSWCIPFALASPAGLVPTGSAKEGP